MKKFVKPTVKELLTFFLWFAISLSEVLIPSSAGSFFYRHPALDRLWIFFACWMFFRSINMYLARNKSLALADYINSCNSLVTIYKQEIELLKQRDQLMVNMLNEYAGNDFDISVEHSSSPGETPIFPLDKSKLKN